MAEKLGRPVQRPSSDDGTLPPAVSTPGFVDLFPYLAEFLIKSAGSGQKTTTGTMTLFLEHHRFKLCMNDRAHSRSAFVSGPTLSEALRAANDALASGRVNWRTRGYIKAPDRQMVLNRY